MADNRFCGIRFNLNKPEHRKAWEYLQTMDRKEFKSYSNIFITALNEYIDRCKQDKSIEMLAEQIAEAVCRSIGKVDFNKNQQEEEIEWGFAGD